MEKSEDTNTDPYRDWKHIGAAIGAALSVMAAGYASGQNHGAGQSAAAAEHSVVITSEMLDMVKERDSSLEARIKELERRQAALEVVIALERHARIPKE